MNPFYSYDTFVYSIYKPKPFSGPPPIRGRRFLPPPESGRFKSRPHGSDVRPLCGRLGSWSGSGSGSWSRLGSGHAGSGRCDIVPRLERHLVCEVGDDLHGYW